MMSPLRALWLCTCLICILTACGCARYQPRPIQEVPFLERAQSKSDGDVRVTVAVLSAEESKELFGVNLAGKGIQPVWLEVENDEDIPFWFLSPGLDPDYYSPREAAYPYRYATSKTANREMDEHFRNMAFQNPVAPGSAVSGFVFANRDEGVKVVDIDLVGRQRVKNFTFFVHIPGIKADYHAVDFDGLYSEDEIVHLDEDALRAALESLPCCTKNKDGTESGDPLNLVVIGHREDLFPAFVRRGWHPAEQTYGKAVWKTVKSFLFGERYRYSPVSPLHVFGRQQDLALQKPRHTVHQRNHLRLWLTAMRFEGKEVWIGQISRDIGVRFTWKTFPTTHKIDPDVDEARVGLIEDLLYSQALAKIGFTKGVGAAPPDNPRRNLTGDPYFTDGLRAVLIFDRRPTSLAGLQTFDWERLPR